MIRIEREKNLNIIRTFVSDKLTAEDYHKMLQALQQSVNEWDGVRWYLEMKDFSGWEVGTARKDLRFLLENAEEVARIAIVGSARWQEWFSKAMKPFTAAELRCFSLAEKEEAKQWVLA